MRPSLGERMFGRGFLKTDGPLEAPAGRTTCKLRGHDNYCSLSHEGSQPLPGEGRP
jgi:hypothetical protein